MPPLVRPIKRPRPPFDAQTGNRTVCFQVSCIDHQSLFLTVISSQADHHPDKNAFVTLSLPTIAQGLVRAVISRRITPAQTIAIDENQFRSEHACRQHEVYHGTTERKGQDGPSARRSTRIDQTCSPLAFRHVDHAAKRKSVGPEPTTGVGFTILLLQC